MRKIVHDILERELRKLDELSKTTGLDLNDFKRLDLLIKAHQTFAADSDPTTRSTSVASQSSQDIINELLKANDNT